MSNYWHDNEYDSQSYVLRIVSEFINKYAEPNIKIQLKICQY